MDHTTPAPVESSGQRPGLLANRSFALLFTGAGISYLGDFVFNTTLILWIAASIGRGQSWAPMAVSGCLLATSLPVLLVGPVAGVFVDRWDKRRTMLAVDLMRAAAIALLLPATNIVPLPLVPGGRFSPIDQLVAIYVIVFFTSAFSQFFGPARMALIGDIVPEEERARATGLLQMTGNLAIVVGPALAAPVYFAAGAEWALAADALSFAASFGAVLAIRAPRSARSLAPGEQGSVAREFAEGVRFMAGNRVLRAIVIAGAVVMLGAGALDALDIFFVTENLRADASLYGLLQAAFGVGAVAGALGASIFARKLGVARTFWAGILAVAVLLMVYSRLTGFVPAMVVLFLAGVPEAGLNVAIGPMVLHVTPRAMIGRIMAVLGPSITLASMVSMALAGYLVSAPLKDLHARLAGFTFGRVDTVFLMSGLVALVGGLYAMRALRGLRLAGEGVPAREAASAIVDPSLEPTP